MEISEELEMVYNENMKEMESEEISIEEEETEMQEVVKKILSVSEELESIDSYFEQLSSLQSKVDEELSDLLHFIENPKNRLNNRQSAKLIDYIREKRIERRGLFNDFEIKRVFNDNRNKICYTNQRQFFLNAIHKKQKELNNAYKPRRLSDEDIWARIK